MSDGVGGLSSKRSCIARNRNKSIIDSPDSQLLPGGSTQRFGLNYFLFERYLEFLRNPDVFLRGELGTEPFSAKEFNLAWKIVKKEQEQDEEYLNGLLGNEAGEDDKIDSVPGVFKRPSLASYERFKKIKSTHSF